MDEAQVAFRAEIGFAVLLLDQRAFRRLDRREHRRAPVIGAIDAHAKVDLVAARIVGIHLDQRQQRIGRLGFQLSLAWAAALPRRGPSR